MTNTITHVKRRGLLVGALVLGSLLFTNCSSDDDSPEPPVVEEFEEVKDLDPVVDPEPEVTEPETGEVGQSAETNSIVADILAANEAGEVDASTEAGLAKVEEAAAEMPAEVTEVAQALDEAAVDILLDEEQELQGSMADLQARIRELPEEVLALLPAISFPVEVDGVSGTAVYKTRTVGLPEILDAIAQVEGSCFELNREAYDALIEDLSAQRDENLSVVNSNYTRRLQEAESRYTARLAQHETKYSANKEELKLVIMSLLQAAEVLKFLGLTQMEQQIRLLALFYTIEAKTALAEWDAAVRVVLLQYKDAETQTALTLRDTKTAEVVAAFEASKAQAKGLLDAALAKCHDQGSGN